MLTDWETRQSRDGLHPVLWTWRRLRESRFDDAGDLTALDIASLHNRSSRKKSATTICAARRRRATSVPVDVQADRGRTSPKVETPLTPLLQMSED